MRAWFAGCATGFLVAGVLALCPDSAHADDAYAGCQREYQAYEQRIRAATTQWDSCHWDTRNIAKPRAQYRSSCGSQNSTASTCISLLRQVYELQCSQSRALAQCRNRIGLYIQQRRQQQQTTQQQNAAREAEIRAAQLRAQQQASAQRTAYAQQVAAARQAHAEHVAHLGNLAAQQQQAAAQQQRQALDEQARRTRETLERMESQRQAAAHLRTESQRASMEGLERGQAAVQKERSARAQGDIAAALQAWQAPESYSAPDTPAGEREGSAAIAGSLMDLSDPPGVSAQLSALSTASELVAIAGPEVMRQDARVVATIAGPAAEGVALTEDLIRLSAGDATGARDALLLVGDRTLNPLSAEGGHIAARQLDTGFAVLDSLRDAPSWDANQAASRERQITRQASAELIDSMFRFQPIATTQRIGHYVERVEAVPTTVSRRFDEVWFSLRLRMGLACEDSVFSTNPCERVW